MSCRSLFDIWIDIILVVEKFWRETFRQNKDEGKKYTDETDNPNLKEASGSSNADEWTHAINEESKLMGAGKAYSLKDICHWITAHINGILCPLVLEQRYPDVCCFERLYFYYTRHLHTIQELNVFNRVEPRINGRSGWQDLNAVNWLWTAKAKHF